MTKIAKPLPNLEESLAEITQVIDKMEHGQLSLEQSLGQFERGVVLIKHCQKILEDAEQKVQRLIQNENQDTLISDGEEENGNPGTN